MHPYDQLCEAMLKHFVAMDGDEWLAATKRKRKPLSLFEFDPEESAYVVENVYAMGANRVRVLGSDEAMQGEDGADCLLIDLPQDSASREQIFAFEAQVAAESGFKPTPDEGQQFLLVRWT